MTAGTREHLRYDPAADAAERWPGWRIKPTDLDGVGEVFLVGSRRILIDCEAYEHDEDFALAHVVAHLDLHLGALGAQLTQDQEHAANTLALIRLDREGTR